MNATRMGRLLAAGLMLAVTGAHAQDEGGGGWFDPDLTISGFVRAEAAFRTSSDENPFNQRGNLFNDVGVRRQAGYPLGSGLIPGTGIVGDILGAVGLNDITLIRDIATRNTPKADNDFNVLHLRGQTDIEFRIAQGITGLVRVRGIFDPTEYDEFDPRSVNSNADGYLYGRPNYFEYDKFYGGGRQNRLELVGEDYMVDLPAAYIDFQYGPVLARVGNQQIAWGQALFFRVFDVPNGLDLRRHLILDFASEEYADERISSPGLRLSWQFAEAWEVEGFAQMFQPTVYPNPNTPYNVIPSQFTVHDSFAEMKDELNYGVRLRGRIGDFGLQAIYADRVNPDGVFRWTRSNVNRDVPGIPGVSGAVLAQTPLEIDPTGVWSAEEWFTYAGMARLDGLEGLNSLIREFPASQLLLAAEVSTVEEAKRELDLFFALAGGKLNNPLDILNPNAQGAGGFRGHIARDYYREDNFGLGASYVVEAEPGSILDQLIINLEVMYTPNRRYTDISLAQAPLEDEEYIGALVMEKYQRFSEAFPATYLVFQWMHRTKSDMFGRHLSGMGGTVNSAPKGIDAWDGLVFALQQPFPNLIWRADLAVLYDTRGGIFVQPALRWKPSGAITVEAFYNYTDGELSGNPNENVISTIDFSDEFGLRLGYQF